VFVCICHAVTEREVREQILLGATTEQEIGRRCGAGTECGSCLDRICDLIEADGLASQAPLRVAG
jgi:bacterioferritin-associated ferredoxin